MISEQDALERRWYVGSIWDHDKNKAVFADCGGRDEPIIQDFLHEATARRVAEDHNKLLEMGV